MDRFAGIVRSIRQVMFPNRIVTRMTRDPKIRVLIADDHSLFAQALRGDPRHRRPLRDRRPARRTAQEAVELARVARAGRRAHGHLDARPRRLPGDARAPQEGGPGCRCSMLTGSNARGDVDKARASGAAGYVTKDRIAERADRGDRGGRGAVASSLPLRRDAPGSRRLHVLVSMALVGLILMHSGRDAGLGGMGFTPQSQGGTHIVERNLTRVTMAVAIIFAVNTIVLFRWLCSSARARRLRRSTTESASAAPVAGPPHTLRVALAACRGRCRDGRAPATSDSSRRRCARSDVVRARPGEIVVAPRPAAHRLPRGRAASRGRALSPRRARRGAGAARRHPRGARRRDGRRPCA